MAITRHGAGPRMSAAVVHNNTVYLAGMVAEDPSADIKGQTEQVLKKIDMGQKLKEAGYDDMSSAVRPMAFSPDERYLYFQVSFFHGFVEYDLQQDKVLRLAYLPVSQKDQNTPREQYVLDSAHHGLQPRLLRCAAAIGRIREKRWY